MGFVGQRAAKSRYSSSGGLKYKYPFGRAQVAGRQRKIYKSPTNGRFYVLVNKKKRYINKPLSQAKGSMRGFLRKKNCIYSDPSNRCLKLGSKRGMRTVASLADDGLISAAIAKCAQSKNSKRRCALSGGRAATKKAGSGRKIVAKNKCQHKLTRGDRKGRKCGKPARGKFCYRHKAKKQ